jgi:hypothetical protein
LYCTYNRGDKNNKFSILIIFIPVVQAGPASLNPRDVDVDDRAAPQAQAATHPQSRAPHPAERGMIYLHDDMMR